MTKQDSKIQELHLDLDGLFADFDLRVTELSGGKHPKHLEKKHLWATIHRDKQFFANLKLIPGSERLWEAIKDLLPDHKIKFLTGAPASAAFQQQKRDWVAEKFGVYETNVVKRRDKQLWSAPYRVLIDDTEGNLHDWIVKGGHGIHHAGDFDATIRALVEYHEALQA
jgi:5'(3')-deoxyribonucleotidase